MTIMTHDPELLLDFYSRLGAVLTERDPQLEAEVIDDSLEVYVLKIRLTTERALGITTTSSEWGLSLLEMQYGEWTYVGDDDVRLECAVPDFVSTITDEELQKVAEAIEQMVEDYRFEYPDQGQASVREYFKLAEDTRNPTFTEEQHVEGWSGQRGFNEGTIFVILRETGQPPQMYPAGRMTEAVAPDSPLYQTLRPRLLYTPSPFRAVLAEERADPVSILEELIRRGIRMLRTPRTRPLKRCRSYGQIGSGRDNP
jgi:hypothetical protein